MQKQVQAGFTLIELMITVAIIVILASVAYPNYTSYLAKGKRNAAQSFMQTLGSKEEQQLLNTRCYFSYPTDAACTPPAVVVPSEVSTTYDVTIVATNAAGAPPTYTITATPSGSQATKDAKCGTLSLTNTGVKGATGSSGAVACWK
jgi:type IV pilus assembly protein PilE